MVEIKGDLNSGIISKIKFDEVESDTLNILENPTYTEDEEYMKIISNVIKMDIEEADHEPFSLKRIKKLLEWQLNFTN